MKLFDQGSLVRVTVSEAEVMDFAERWPCFGQVGPFSFTFEKANGDLVDFVGDSDSDESGVVALADDAKAYARGKGLLK